MIKSNKLLLNALNVNVNNGTVWLGLVVAITLILNPMPSSILTIPNPYPLTPNSLFSNMPFKTFTFTLRAFGRCFYPKRLTISTFVRRRNNNISLSVQ